MFEDIGDDMPPWKSLTKAESVEIVSPEGEVRSRVDAYFPGGIVIIDDMSVDVRAGDEIRRRLPNGNEEAFHVDDPQYFGSGGFGKHYQIKVSRPRIHAPKTGGNYNIHVTGENARVNLHSTDNSTNVVQTNSVFNQARDAISQAGLAADKADELRQQVTAMEAATTQPKFFDAYNKFVGMVADHIAVFGPVIAMLGAAAVGLLPH